MECDSVNKQFTESISILFCSLTQQSGMILQSYVFICIYVCSTEINILFPCLINKQIRVTQLITTMGLLLGHLLWHRVLVKKTRQKTDWLASSVGGSENFFRWEDDDRGIIIQSFLHRNNIISTNSGSNLVMLGFHYSELTGIVGCIIIVGLYSVDLLLLYWWECVCVCLLCPKCPLHLVIISPSRLCLVFQQLCVRKIEIPQKLNTNRDSNSGGSGFGIEENRESSQFGLAKKQLICLGAFD